MDLKRSTGVRMVKRFREKLDEEVDQPREMD
jgi:hypothetical protein